MYNSFHKTLPFISAQANKEHTKIPIHQPQRNTTRIFCYQKVTGALVPAEAKARHFVPRWRGWPIGRGWRAPSAKNHYQQKTKKQPLRRFIPRWRGWPIGRGWRAPSAKNHYQQKTKKQPLRPFIPRWRGWPKAGGGEPLQQKPTTLATTWKPTHLITTTTINVSSQTPTSSAKK